MMSGVVDGQLVKILVLVLERFELGIDRTGYSEPIREVWCKL